MTTSFRRPSRRCRRRDLEQGGTHEPRSVLYHGSFLLAYAAPIVLLAKQIAVPIDYGISVLGAPAVLERTNVLLGAVHVLLFLAYLIVIFEK